MTVTATTSTTSAASQLDVVDYPTYMVAMNAAAPSIFGDGWRDEWLRRVDGPPLAVISFFAGVPRRLVLLPLLD